MTKKKSCKVREAWDKNKDGKNIVVKHKNYQKGDHSLKDVCVSVWDRLISD